MIRLSLIEPIKPRALVGHALKDNLTLICFDILMLNPKKNSLDCYCFLRKFLLVIFLVLWGTNLLLVLCVAVYNSLSVYFNAVLLARFGLCFLVTLLYGIIRNACLGIKSLLVLLISLIHILILSCFLLLMKCCGWSRNKEMEKYFNMKRDLTEVSMKHILSHIMS
jgi:hypothetical protein